MSFLRHREIFPSDGGAGLTANTPAHRLDEFPAGYSLAGCAPAEPAAASPADHYFAGSSFRRTMSFHRTASCGLTGCLSQGSNLDSFDASVTRDRQTFANAKTGVLRISNRDVDTGKPVSPGEYVFTDKTYDKLLVKLAQKDFNGVTPELRENVLNFYARMKSPDQHGIESQLVLLRASTGPQS